MAPFVLASSIWLLECAPLDNLMTKVKLLRIGLAVDVHLRSKRPISLTCCFKLPHLGRIEDVVKTGQVQ